jgi:hypothetical protein
VNDDDQAENPSLKPHPKSLHGSLERATGNRPKKGRMTSETELNLDPEELSNVRGLVIDQIQKKSAMSRNQHFPVAIRDIYAGDVSRLERTYRKLGGKLPISELTPTE